jgi:Family of unknown function (DUF6328)
MADDATDPGTQTEQLPLRDAAEFLLNECRMVLPGIQALFGFQLIAVYNAGFREKLTVPEQDLHLFAIGLIAIAVALIMTPAAFHRQAGSRQISEAFIRLCARLLGWSMVPLALAISIDFFLVAQIIMHNDLVAWLAAAVLGVFFAMWFVLPRWLLART